MSALIDNLTTKPYTKSMNKTTNQKTDITSYQKLIKDHAQQFEIYYQNLIEYNQKINLTAITQRDEVFTKHFLDSILSITEIPNSAKVIDIGAGAGFPSLAIKIVRPDIQLTMLDSLNKRIQFLNQLTQTLNVQTTNVHSRAEDYARLTRQTFDIALARAVAKTNTLVEYLLPFVKVGGKVILYKSANCLQELKEAQNAIKQLGGAVTKTLHFALPNEEGERTIIVITKTSPTPAKFPRPANQPKLKPIT